jgi:L-asparaginase II
LQKDLRRLLSTKFGEDLDSAPWGIDGCGIPTSAVSLFSLASGSAQMLAPLDSVQKIIRAMQKYPELVGGTEDFTSQVIKACGGRAVIKTGAEGVFLGMIFENKIGFALKALDGHSRASQAATAYLLRKWGGLSHWENPPVRNWKGDIVGSVQVIEKQERT